MSDLGCGGVALGFWLEYKLARIICLGVTTCHGSKFVVREVILGTETDSFGKARLL